MVTSPAEDSQCFVEFEQGLAGQVSRRANARAIDLRNMRPPCHAPATTRIVMHEDPAVGSHAGVDLEARNIRGTGAVQRAATILLAAESADPVTDELAAIDTGTARRRAPIRRSARIWIAGRPRCTFLGVLPIPFQCGDRHAYQSSRAVGGKCHHRYGGPPGDAGPVGRRCIRRSRIRRIGSLDVSRCGRVVSVAELPGDHQPAFRLSLIRYRVDGLPIRRECTVRLQACQSGIDPAVSRRRRRAGAHVIRLRFRLRRGLLTDHAGR